MKVILINGEKQIGKSTLARALSDELNQYFSWKKSAETAGVYSIVAPLAAAIVEMNPAWRHIPYEEIKMSRVIEDSDFPNISGRDIMIQFGNALIGLHPWILSAMAYQKAKHFQESVMIVENWGRMSEYDYFVRLVEKKKIELITVALTARQKSAAVSGEQFPDDNRVRLDYMAECVDWDFTRLMRRITNDHKYAFVDRISALFPPQGELPLTADTFESRMAAGVGLTE